MATRPLLDESWDLMLRCCMVLAALTGVVCLAVPACAELAIFAWLMFVTSGPTATFLPSASEPVLMLFGRLHSPWMLASLAVAAIAIVEWVNYRVFDAVLGARMMSAVRSATLTRTLTRWFRASPFATTVVGALTPVPFWGVRVCAVTAGYSMPRFIVATVVGRFPRVWLFAFLGAALPTGQSILLLVAGIVVVVGLVTATSKLRGRSPARGEDPRMPGGRLAATDPL